MDIDNSIPPTPEEEAAQARILELCETGKGFEELSLQEIVELLKQTGLPELPSDHTRRHTTKEWYFQIQDSAICYLVYTPMLGYGLDIISRNAEYTEDELTTIRQIKEMSAYVQLKITDALKATLDEL